MSGYSPRPPGVRTRRATEVRSPMAVHVIARLCDPTRSAYARSGTIACKASRKVSTIRSTSSP